mmetsp:Transcript_15432/g.60310  ORF Transcript_15432/g.60310 Transcript_15432/m.60310 type:complete len:205 (-) Transcript_15432:24-638(-)
MAAQNGHLGVLQLLLDSEEPLVDFNSTDQTGRTALHTVALFGSIATLKFFCSVPDSRQDFNHRDDHGRTILHVVIKCRTGEIIRLVAEEFKNRGLDVNSRGRFAQTPLHYAASRSGKEIRILADSLGDLIDWTAVTNTGFTALHLAVDELRGDAIRALVDLLPAIVFSMRCDAGRTAREHALLRGVPEHIAMIPIPAGPKSAAT